MPPARDIPELLLGLGIAGLGLFICYDAAGIKVAPVYAKVGPAVFPWMIGGTLALAGGVVSVMAARGPAAARPPAEYPGVAAIALGLLLQTVLFERAGFILSAVMVFLLTAWGFGSRKFLRDAVIAVLLAAAAYFVFTRGLGLRLPRGVIPL